MTAMERFQLLAISTDDVSDEQVKSAFLNLEVGSEAELQEALSILKKYRPEVYQKLQPAPEEPFHHDQ